MVICISSSSFSSSSSSSLSSNSIEIIYPLSFKELFNYSSLLFNNNIFNNYKQQEEEQEEQEEEEEERVYLYCNQNEICYNISSLLFDIIGSDDATTCHIILISTSSSSSSSHNPNNLNNLNNLDTSQDNNNNKGEEDIKWLVTHISSKNQINNLKQYLDDMNHNNNNNNNNNNNSTLFNVYVMGGLEGDELSESISQGLVDLFNSLDYMFHIRLFSTCECNTIYKTIDDKLLPFPRFFGCGYVKSLNQVIPIHFPINFRQPDYILRSALLWARNDSSLIPLYNGNDGIITVDYSCLNTKNCRKLYSFFSSVRQLLLNGNNDQLVLNHVSTSPHCEPQDFLPSILNTSKIIMDIAENRLTIPQYKRFLVEFNTELNKKIWKEVNL